MKKVSPLTFLAILLVISCTNNRAPATEKIQKHRDKTVNVSDKIIDIKTDIVFGKSSLYIIDNILIVQERYPKGEKVFHLFNKETFKYITSTGILGRGPGEISTPSSSLGIDPDNRLFWMPDLGKKVIHKFPLDSVLSDKLFKPAIAVKLNDRLTLWRFNFLNDSIVMGKAAEPFSNSSFGMAMVKLNINNAEISKFGYENPKVEGEKTNSFPGMSIKEGVYVNCYTYEDLITICDLDGNLKYNIYGPGWFDSEKRENAYFNHVEVFDKHIYASYVGGRRTVVKGNVTRGAYPQKILIFGLDGSYLKTIETGSEFCSFCIDEKNNRIIAYFDDREESLGYFDIPL